MKKTTIIAILFSIFIIFFNNLPVLYGYLAQNDGLSYTGRRYTNSQDVYTYVAFIEQARQGRVLFENLYNPVPQKASLFRPSYLIIGNIARITGMSSIIVYHISRILLAAIFCFVLFKFLKRFFPRDRDRLISFIVVLTSAGIGVFVGWLAPNSTDLWVPESITFLAMAEAPHFIFSLILMLLGFMAYFKAYESKKIIFSVISALLFFLLAFEHPFNLFVTGAAIFITSVYYYFTYREDRKNLILGSAIILGATALGIFYQWFETIQNPILSSWYKESSLLSPDPHNYIYGYGFLLILGAVGIEKALHEKRRDMILLVVWIAVAAIFLYSPVPFQRRFSEGLQIPIAIFATIGLIKFCGYISRFSVKFAKGYVFYGVLVFSILVLSATPIYAVFNDISVISADSQQSYYYHLLPSEVNGIYYLGKITNRNDVILSNWFYGNYIPGMIGRKVYLGHKVQTPDFDQKVADMNKFFLEKDTKKAEEFIKSSGFTYIFLGDNDTITRYGFKPDAKQYLQKVYDKDGVRIYKVKPL